MAILIECTACGRKTYAKDQFRGKKVRCPGCNEKMDIEGPRVPDHDVFVSYSSNDKPVAEAVCGALESQRVRCWIAPRDIAAGANWGSAIIGAIEDCRIMVVIYSSHANMSQQVLREVERAVAKNVTIIPFRIEDAKMSPDMEYFLSATHWLDAMGDELDSHLGRLVTMTKTMLVQLDGAAQGRTLSGAEASALAVLAGAVTGGGGRGEAPVAGPRGASIDVAVSRRPRKASKRSDTKLLAGVGVFALLILGGLIYLVTLATRGNNAPPQPAPPGGQAYASTSTPTPPAPSPQPPSNQRDQPGYRTPPPPTDGSRPVDANGSPTDAPGDDFDATDAFGKPRRDGVFPRRPRSGEAGPIRDAIANRVREKVGEFADAADGVDLKDTHMFDVLRAVDPRREPGSGGWEIDNGRLVSPGGGHQHYQLTAVSVMGDYQLTMFIGNVDGQTPRADVLIPVGRAQVWVVINGEGGAASGLREVAHRGERDPQNTTHTNVSMQGGREYGVSIRCTHTSGRQFHVVVELDTKPLFEWDGDPIELSPGGWDIPALNEAVNSASGVIGFGAEADRRYYRDVRLTVTDGRAKLMHGGAKPLGGFKPAPSPQ
ncbi:MAG: TIR domain-containing protein [Phycisphaera sp.]|nr:TIR domain-containing protein [Phycisphaera sp.]